MPNTPRFVSRSPLLTIVVVALFAFVAVHQMYFARPVSAAISVFINEFHYDNASTDAGEAIEIAGPAGTNLSGWSIVLYNGSGGASYNTNNLSRSEEHTSELQSRE